MEREKLHWYSIVLVISLLMVFTAGAAMADEPMFWPADRQYIANDGSSADSRAILTDHDGDGDLDIIAYYDDGWYKWLENNGDGSYKAPVILPEDFEPIRQIDADLDGDGDTDYISGLFYVSWRNYVFRVYLNNGSGDYSYADYKAYGVLNLTDLDGDGDLDITMAGSEYGRLQACPSFMFDRECVFNLTGCGYCVFIGHGQIGRGISGPSEPVCDVHLSPAGDA